MATDERVAPQVVLGAGGAGREADVVGRSDLRRTLGLVGQYAMLVALAAVVLLPVIFTVVQALTPPTSYITNRSRPLHPMDVAWKDRTWFTGGTTSVLVRTAVVVFLFAWLQRVGSGHGWREWSRAFTPTRLASVVVGTVALTLLVGPVYRSLESADGATLGWFLLAVAGVALTQFPGFASGHQRGPAIAGLIAALAALSLVGLAVVAAGAEVWTVTWGRADLGAAMRQSLTMTVLITGLQVTTAILAAYAFVYLRFPAKRLVFVVFMGTMLLPMEVTLVGNVATIRQLEWMNSMQALVLPLGASALGTFLIRQGFRGVPPELYDAARLDGYGHLRFLTRVVVPLTRPVIASFTVIAALSAWNQYLWPRAVIEDNRFGTIQTQLRLSASENLANGNEAIAAALVAALPVVLLLVAFQKQIIRGLTAGAVK
jgi:sn-glycerol 3-phosphate transport system permease protein